MSRTESGATTAFEPSQEFARHLDETDSLREYRDRFHIPRRPNGEPVIYFAGNSLGLQPKTVRAMVEQELDDWAELAVDAHLKARTPWYSYHEVFGERGDRLVGALPGAREVVMMNSLTINLHLMMVSFFRPTPKRRKILMEHPAFPSDLYAVRTHLRSRGLESNDSLVQIKPREGEHTVRTEDIEGFLDEQGEQIALVLLPGVNFHTGQVFDMARIAAAARKHG
ncbi:MAG: kynureninase, partial [Planctomycetes bacterium]|nr:kynureninase [Planctomycetota bacterium]